MDYICPSIFVLAFGFWSTICFTAGHMIGRMKQKYEPEAD